MIALKSLFVFVLLYSVRCEHHDHPPPPPPEFLSEHDGGHDGHNGDQRPPPPLSSKFENEHDAHQPAPPLPPSKSAKSFPQQQLLLQTTNQLTNSTGSQTDNSSYCEPENCPPFAIMVLLILTKDYPDASFESIQSFVSDVVEACEVAEHEMRFTYTNGRENEFQWVTDEKYFDSVQRTASVKKFQWPKPPKPDELAESIKHMIGTLGASDSIPRNAEKYIFIISDFDLKVDGEGAKSIRDQLVRYHIQVEVVKLPSENSSSESREVSALDVNISEIDPSIRKFHFDNIDDVSRFIDDMIMCAKVIRAKPEPKSDDLHEADEDRLAFLAVIIAAVLLVIVLIAFLTLFYIKSKLKWKTKISKFRAATYSQSSAHSQQITMKEINKMNNSDDWTLPREQLEMFYDQKLGSGAFCCVYKGKLSGAAPVCKINPSIQASRLYSDCEVAIKMLPPYTDDLAKSDFFQEMNFMKALNYHPHLICLLGTAWDQFEPCLITEYCVNGDLLHFVREKKEEIKNAEGRPNELRLKDLLCFAWQISDGMDFLSSKGCIHRDLAARNVLVDHTNTAKEISLKAELSVIMIDVIYRLNEALAFYLIINEWGTKRNRNIPVCKLTDSPLYSARGGRLPIKWMAIESLRCYEYSSKSDVWSFGVLLYELFSLGDVPFPRVQPVDMIDHLTAGNRLEQPEYCTDEIYDLMQSCWHASPDDRPSFETVRSRLAAIIESSSINYGYLSFNDGNDRRSLIAHNTDDDRV